MISVELPAVTVITGKLTVAAAGAPIGLPDNPCRAVTVKARKANAGIIYVTAGASGAANGYDLNPGEQIDLGIQNTNLLSIDAAVGNDAVSWLALR